KAVAASPAGGAPAGAGGSHGGAAGRPRPLRPPAFARSDVRPGHGRRTGRTRSVASADRFLSTHGNRTPVSRGWPCELGPRGLVTADPGGVPETPGGTRKTDN